MRERAINDQADVTGYINAGGRGTRLNAIFNPHPEYGVAKALLEVGSPPIKLVDHHISRMGQTAFRNILVGVGDLVAVSDYINRAYSSSKKINAISTDEYGEQLGTAGDLVVAVRKYPNLFGEHILIQNVDTILDINNQEFIAFHKASGSTLTIALTRQSGVPNENAFFLDADQRIIHCLETDTNLENTEELDRRTTMRASSTGALIIEKDFIKAIAWKHSDGQLSLYRDVMKKAISEGLARGFNNGTNFFTDVGTASSWTEAEETGMLQDYLSYSSTGIQS